MAFNRLELRWTDSTSPISNRLIKTMDFFTWNYKLYVYTSTTINTLLLCFHFTMQLLPQGLFLVLPLSLPSTPYCRRRPSLNSLPSHRLAVSNRCTNVKPRAIRCCHFYTARCTCRLQLMVRKPNIISNFLIMANCLCYNSIPRWMSIGFCYLIVFFSKDLGDIYEHCD